MQRMDEAEMEELLLELEAAGYPFPEYRFCRENGRLQLLGQGTSAFVFEMEDCALPQKHYALKVIGLADAGVPPKKFWDNVTWQRRLAEQSPYIVSVFRAVQFQVFLDEDGHFLRGREVTWEEAEVDGLLLQFLLMEKLEPILELHNYRQPVVRRPELFELPKLLTFAAQVGNALETAHENNILHRDVKLENIFWSEEDHCYKLGDFGVARLVENQRAETVVYTDGYRAPEIDQFIWESYDQAADIYSFGICLYLLLNDLCFPGANSYFERWAQYSDAFLFPAPKHAPKAVARVLRTFCSYCPQERYPSVEEGLTALISAAQEADRPAQAGEDGQTMTETLQTTETTGSTKIPLAPNLRKIPLRLQRRMEAQAAQHTFRQENLFFLLALTAVFTMMLCSWNAGIPALDNWPFWVMLAMAVTETALLEIDDLHRSFALVGVLFGLWSMKKYGANLPMALLILCMASHNGVLSLAGGLSGALWAWLNLSGEIHRLNWASSWDLGWLFLLLALLIGFVQMVNAAGHGKVGTLAFWGHVLFFFILVPAAGVAALLWPLLAKSGQWMRGIHPIRICLIYVPYLYCFCKSIIEAGKEAEHEETTDET